MKNVVLLMVASSLALALACGGCSSSGSGGSGGSDGSGGSSGSGGSGCIQVMGTEASQVCSYSNTSAGITCTNGLMSGSCPTTDLFGCCVTTSSDPAIKGGTITSATCYYSSAVGGDAMIACGKSWQKTAP
jgi:hypothetical protein